MNAEDFGEPELFKCVGCGRKEHGSFVAIDEHDWVTAPPGWRRCKVPFSEWHVWACSPQCAYAAAKHRTETGGFEF